MTRGSPPRGSPSPARPPLLRPGGRLRVRFDALGRDGLAEARVGNTVVAAAYGIPGEEALVEVIAVERHRARARIVSLLRKSPDVAPVACHHFGRCGGCQWQHLAYPAQLHYKAALIRSVLHEQLKVPPELVRPALGGPPLWEYRHRLAATFAAREGTPVAGFHALGGRRVIDVVECPVQHPTNVRILAACRAAVRRLGLPVYDPATDRGVVRGVVALTAFATGEAMMVLGTRRSLVDRDAFVRAVLDTVPDMVSVMESAQRGRGSEVVGRRADLLWGRPHLLDEVAGIRLRLTHATPLPASPLGLPRLLGAVEDLAALAAGETAVDPYGGCGLAALHLARRGARVLSVVPTDLLDDARDAVRLNGAEGCIFYTRDPARALAKIGGRGGPVHAAILQPPGEGADAEVLRATAGLGVARVVYVGRSLPTLVRDVGRLQALGYAVAAVQPVDLAPHVSTMHVVVRMERAGP